MSGDMSNNPDATASFHEPDSKVWDEKSTLGISDIDVQACWGRVNQRMRKDIGDAAWRHWIKPLRISGVQDGTLTL